MENNQLKSDNNSNGKKIITIYDRIEKYLFSKYDIFYNEISTEFKISLKSKNNWKELNESSLVIELAKAGIPRAKAPLETFLTSDKIERRNPIKNYFEDLDEWDGIDHIAKLASYVPVSEDDKFHYHLKKWLVRAVKCVLIPEYFNKQAFILVHQGQSSGKSTWCRFLCPEALKEYITEDLGNDKDSQIQLSKNFLINLDELAVLSNRNIDTLKSYFSKTAINIRLPYARKNSLLPRFCSFVGSTNSTSFLKDETGNVRWLCFELIDKIDFAYSKEVNMDKVWAQAYHLMKDPSFNAELTTEDLNENENRNSQFVSLNTEQEFILKYYEKSDDMEDWKSASDVKLKLDILAKNMSVERIGKAFTGFGYTRVKNSQRKNSYGYLAKAKFKKSPGEIEFPFDELKNDL